MKYPSLLVPVLLFHAGLCLPAQSWTEAGDAGSLPRSAQTPVGNGPLTSISGVLGLDPDMFAIEIDDPSAFSASTVGRT